MQRNTLLSLLGVVGLAVAAAGVTYWLAQPPDGPVGPPAAKPAPGRIDVANAGKRKRPTKLRTKLKGRNFGPLKLGEVTLSNGGTLVAPTSMLEELPTGPIPEGNRLLIVTWDTVRADHVSAYGYFRDTTPTFDALAAEGLLFENYLVPQSTTLPTHVSMFTGVHPDEHGITGNSASGARRFVAPENLDPLARHLGKAGYATAGFVSSGPLKQYSGIADGFQMWSEPRSRSRLAENTTRAAVTWLEEVDENRPFFLWVHHYDPHAPYRTPEGYERVFPQESAKPWLEERGMLENDVAKRVANMNAYDAEIRYVDDHLKPLLEALQVRGFEDDTIVVVAGDHGEGLGQHEHEEHGLVWTEQLAAPLAIRAPGVAPERIATFTAAQDLLPILAGLGEFPSEEAFVAQSSGRDVLADRTDKPLLSRTSRRQLKTLKKGGNQVMAWSLNTPEYQFIYREDGNHSLFDPKADPHALNDLAAAQPAKVAKLVTEIEAMMATQKARAEELGAGKTEPISAEIVEELKELGYLD